MEEGPVHIRFRTRQEGAILVERLKPYRVPTPPHRGFPHRGAGDGRVLRELGNGSGSEHQLDVRFDGLGVSSAGKSE